jgi:hypothetical protein
MQIFIEERSRMTKIRISILLLFLLLVSGPAAPAHAQSGIQLVSDEATLQFPQTATFQAEFTSSANITAVTLEYGVDQLTCGTVVAKAFPEITPSTDVKAEWTWDMRQSGSLLPGATLWWQWTVTDANGTQFTSPQKTILWLDNIHNWKTITGGKINLHYYDGDASFGQALHDAAAQALTRLTQEVGLGTDTSVDIYIYANTNDLKESILYEPAWIGGQASPQTNTVIIGVSTDQLDWGKSTEAHELTHVLVGHLTFSCLGFVPTWLNEGLAMYGEGGPQAAEQTQFDQAKANNQLLSVESLTGGFSEESDRATLSYTESFNIVNFLVKTYGRDKMTALLLQLRDGATIDDALQSVYEFDVNGLEDAWRTSIGAAPRVGTSNPTPVPTPTVVPTIVPFSGETGAAVQTPRATETSNPMGTLEAFATQTASAGPSPTAGPQPSLAERLGINSEVLLVIEFGLVCCVIAVAAVAGPILLTVRRKHRRKS